MSDIDLTEAVTAAARRHHEQTRADNPKKSIPPWEKLHILDQNHIREAVLPLIWAAHRDIAAQALRKVATDLGPQGLADEHMLYEAAAEYEARP